MSPRLGYKQTAEHIRNSKLAKKKSATHKKTTPSYRAVVDPFLVEDNLAFIDMANTDTRDTLSVQPKMDFDAARAYLTRLDTVPNDQLTPEERLIKRMGGKG